MNFASHLLAGPSAMPTGYDHLTKSLAASPLREFIRATAHSLQVHEDFALMNAIGVLATAVNGKFRVVRGSHEEALQLYLLPIAGPGYRKSAVINLVRRPILASASLPETKRMYIDDVTPTALKQALGAAKGCLAAHTAEGSTFTKIMGQRGFAKGVFCAAYDGEEVRLDRANKKPIDLPDAALTLCLACQPSVALSFARTPEVSGQGLLARFLIAEFPEIDGERNVHTERVADSTMGTYEALISRLLAIEPPKLGHRHILELAPDAEATFIAFCEQAERELRPNGLLSFDLAWGAKLHGKVLRVAALLHCASEEHPLNTPIALESMRQAICMANGFTNYARAFFVRVHDEVGEWAREVLDLVTGWANGRRLRPSESQSGEFSASDIRNHLPELSSRQIGAAIERLRQTQMIAEFLPNYLVQCRIPRPGRKGPRKFIAVTAPLLAFPYLPAGRSLSL